MSNANEPSTSKVSEPRRNTLLPSRNSLTRARKLLVTCCLLDFEAKPECASRCQRSWSLLQGKSHAMTYMIEKGWELPRRGNPRGRAMAPRPGTIERHQR
jgi:hypothetical protein